MKFEGKVGDAFNEWIQYRFNATSFEVEQAADVQYALRNKIPLNQVGMDEILKQTGLEKEKLIKISDEIGNYYTNLIDAYVQKAFEDGFQLAAHLLSA